MRKRKKRLDKNIFILLGVMTIMAITIMTWQVMYLGNDTYNEKNFVTKFLTSGNKPISLSPIERKVVALEDKLEEEKNYKLEQFELNVTLKKEIQRLREQISYEDNKTNTIIRVINNNLRGRLAHHGESFYIASKLYNVNPFLMAAICIHETANGTSKLINTHNNAGGLFDGQFIRYRTVEESIFDMARRLKRYYIDMGLTDIESIGRKYCPIGADNDPTGINVHWVPNVTRLYNNIYNQTGGIV